MATQKTWPPGAACSPNLENQEQAPAKAQVEPYVQTISLIMPAAAAPCFECFRENKGNVIKQI